MQFDCICDFCNYFCNIVAFRVERIIRYLAFVVLLTGLQVQAQQVNDTCNHQLSGVVLDSETKEPIPFAQVKVQGENKGAVSTADGTFTIKYDDGEIETYVVEGPRFNQCLSTWADKTPNSVSTSNMFVDTECPGDVTPDATVGPWCQGEEQSCVAVVDDSPREQTECKDSPLRAVTPGQCASGRCGRTCRFIKELKLSIHTLHHT